MLGTISTITGSALLCTLLTGPLGTVNHDSRGTAKADACRNPSIHDTTRYGYNGGNCYQEYQATTAEPFNRINIKQAVNGHFRQPSKWGPIMPVGVHDFEQDQNGFWIYGAGSVVVDIRYELYHCEEVAEAVTVPEPASLSEAWPSSNPGTTLESHQTFFWSVMDTGTAYADELIAEGPLSDHTKEQVNFTINFWHEGLSTVTNGIVIDLHKDARDFWSVIGDVHDGVYVDSGSTPEQTARRLLDTWADYSTAMQAIRTEYMPFRDWAFTNNVYIAPGFI